jgi:hypothetical protein
MQVTADYLQKSVAKLVGERFDKFEFQTEQFPDKREFEYKQAYFKYHAKPFPDWPDYTLYGANLYFIFGNNKIGTIESYYRLGILSTWHLLKNAKSIAAYVGSFDHDRKLKENLRLIQHHLVKQVVLIPEKLHLFLEFDNHIWLAIYPKFVGFHFSETYGAWRAVRNFNWYVHNQEIWNYDLRE